MTDGRTLPGFRKKSFAMPFDGGEIWFEHLDGIYGFTGLVIERSSLQICRSFSARPRRQISGSC